MKSFTREELIDIRQKATELYEHTDNPFWLEAYFDLAMAADRLDAMIARTNVIGTQGPPIEFKPEIKMQSILHKNGIEFVTPFVVKNKIYDLYLPKYNVLIEVDGCYWHNKNRSLENMDKQQLRRWKNDRYKDNLARKNGYKLIRVWEDEIEQFNIHKELIINE